MKTLCVKVTGLLFVFSLAFTSAPASAGSVLDFQAVGSGKVVSYDCDNNDTCTIKDEGIVKGEQIGRGTFTHTAVILWKYGFPNGNGRCAPASGTVTVTASDNSTMTLKRAGIVCGINDAASVFNSAYYVVDGTKRFSDMAGSGQLTCSVDRNGDVLFTLHGVIKK